MDYYNRSLLEKVRDIDQNGFAPLEERIQKIDDPNDPVSLLQAEIKRLKTDAAKYEEQVQNMTKKVYNSQIICTGLKLKK